MIESTEPNHAEDQERLLGILAVPEQDRPDCRRLMCAAPANVDESARQSLLAELRSRFGTFPEDPPVTAADEIPALAAMLDFTPELLAHFSALGIESAVVEATMADFGRHMAISRRVHGRYGMETWKWVANVYSGAMFQLGRLQYLLHRTPVALRNVTSRNWVLGIHIPESGPLDPGAVEESLCQAGRFFASHFPHQPVDTATCESWMLDPYLATQLSPVANIRRFAERFTPFGEPVDCPEDAVYFTFRQRGLANLDRLPRATSLQRVVLERIDDGGAWQLGSGWLRLNPEGGESAPNRL